MSSSEAMAGYSTLWAASCASWCSVGDILDLGSELSDSGSDCDVEETQGQVEVGGKVDERSRFRRRPTRSPPTATSTAIRDHRRHVSAPGQAWKVNQSAPRLEQAKHAS